MRQEEGFFFFFFLYRISFYHFSMPIHLGRAVMTCLQEVIRGSRHCRRPGAANDRCAGDTRTSTRLAACAWTFFCNNNNNNNNNNRVINCATSMMMQSYVSKNAACDINLIVRADIQIHLAGSFACTRCTRSRVTGCRRTSSSSRSLEVDPCRIHSIHW